MMNSQIEDDQMATTVISRYCPDAIYTQSVPQQGAVESSKPKRRRKRNKGGDGTMRKRKLSEEQVNALEQNFGIEHNLDTGRKDRLAAELGLEPRQVAVWFQNRRARWRSKKLEEEYAKVKSLHENAVLEKTHLQTQLLKLKGQLEEAGKEIQRLTAEGSDGLRSNSPSSSISMEAAVDPPFLGEFGMEGLLYLQHNANGYLHGMDWVNPYYM